jgi:uncharacterized FlaG/YvyC family protein
MMDVIKEFWSLIFAGIGGIAWLFRLENKVSNNTTAIAYMEKQRSDDQLAAREARKATAEALDKMHDDLAEIRKDIKDLLKRTE